MNREQIKKEIELYSAMLDGAKIQISDIRSDEWEICEIHNDTLNFNFNFKEYKYRAVYPNLTTDVFNRDDCPKWAKWAAVDSDGETSFFNTKPFIHCSFSYWTNNKGETENKDQLIGKFDATGWQNSLIERKSDIHYQYYVFNCGNSRGAAVTSTNKDDVTCKKCLELLEKQSIESKLPEWCKVGTMVFHDDHLAEITKINDDGRVTYRYTPKIIAGADAASLGGSMGSKDAKKQITPATYVLPTIEDIFQRSSLVVKNKKLGYFSTVTGSNNSKQVYINGHKNLPIIISELDKHFTWLDGTSIGKWVKVAE